MIESGMDIHRMHSIAVSAAIAIEKYRAISGASQSSLFRLPTGRLAGLPCNVFQSLHAALRMSSMRVVDDIRAASRVASATGIRSVSGEILDRSLDGLPHDWLTNGRESPSRRAVSDVAWFGDDMVQRMVYRPGSRFFNVRRKVHSP